MKYLFILNEAPYGGERFFNAMRLSTALLNMEEGIDNEVTLHLMADAVVGARKGQKTPNGYYNIERMLKRFISCDGQVLVCGSCMDARAMTDDDLVDGARRGNMDDLAERTHAADKVLVF